MRLVGASETLAVARVKLPAEGDDVFETATAQAPHAMGGLEALLVEVRVRPRTTIPPPRTPLQKPRRRLPSQKVRATLSP